MKQLDRAEDLIQSYRDLLPPKQTSIQPSTLSAFIKKAYFPLSVALGYSASVAVHGARGFLAFA